MEPINTQQIYQTHVKTPNISNNMKDLLSIDLFRRHPAVSSQSAAAAKANRRRPVLTRPLGSKLELTLLMWAECAWVLSGKVTGAPSNTTSQANPIKYVSTASLSGATTTAAPADFLFWFLAASAASRFFAAAAAFLSNEIIEVSFEGG